MPKEIIAPKPETEYKNIPKYVFLSFLLVLLSISVVYLMVKDFTETTETENKKIYTDEVLIKRLKILTDENKQPIINEQGQLQVNEIELSLTEYLDILEKRMEAYKTTNNTISAPDSE